MEWLELTGKAQTWGLWWFWASGREKREGISESKEKGESGG